MACFPSVAAQLRGMGESVVGSIKNQMKFQTPVSPNVGDAIGSLARSHCHAGGVGCWKFTEVSFLEKPESSMVKSRLDFT